MAPDGNDNSARLFLLLSDDALVAQCHVDKYRSSGPGGQKRNKTSSAVRLRHPPTGVSVTAEEDRSQHVNKARAIRRLRKAIALNVRGTILLTEYTPSSLLTEHIHAGKRIGISRRDTRYFLIIHEVLDVLAACGMSLSDAAEQTGLKTSHLVKLFQADPKLWEKVNQMRTLANLKSLH